MKTTYEGHVTTGVVGVKEVQAETAELYERQVPMLRSVKRHSSSSLLRDLLFDKPRHRWIDPRLDLISVALSNPAVV